MRFLILFVTLCVSLPLHAEDQDLSDLEHKTSIQLKARRLLTQATWRTVGALDEQCSKDWNLPLDWGVYTPPKTPAPEREAILEQRGFTNRVPVVTDAITETQLKARDQLAPVEGNEVSEKAYRQISNSRFINTGGLHTPGGISMYLPFWNTGMMNTVTTPFPLKILGTDKIVEISPYETCSGHVTLSWANKPNDAYPNAFGYSFVSHPYQVFDIDITADEVLWLVLWNQGYIANGNSKQMTVKWGKILTQLIPGPSVVTHADAIRSAISNLGSTVSRVSQNGQDSMEVSAAKAGFQNADTWAFSKLVKLNADITAPLTLSRKLFAANIQDQTLIFDEARQQNYLSMVQSIIDQAQVTSPTSDP